MLAPKLQPHETAVAEIEPKTFFGFGHVFAKSARSSSGGFHNASISRMSDHVKKINICLFTLTSILSLKGEEVLSATTSPHPIGDTHAQTY